MNHLPVLIVLMGFSLASYANAAGCDDYPYTSGINAEDVQGGVKIIATASVGVSFNDVDAVNDARDEATISAKALIARFFQEGVASDETVNRAVNETVSMQGASKSVARTETINRVKQLRNFSSALLRGVVPLGDCYTAGKEMRVSVGLKPETIATAGAAAQAIGQSLAAPQASVPGGGPTGSTSNIPPAASTGQPLNSVPSSSNTQRLNRF